MVAGLAVFGLAEGGARLLIDRRQADLVYDPVSCYFGWEARTHERQQKNGLVFDVWTDQDGFRVGGPTVRRESAACRILALGDSFTEGFFVRADQAWPAALESLLRARGFDVRVDNGGMRGHTIQHEREAAMVRWRERQHAIVVIAHTSNDLRDLDGIAREGCVQEVGRRRAMQSTRSHPLHGSGLIALSREIRVRWEAERLSNHVPSDASGADGPGSMETCRRLAARYEATAVALARSLRAEGRRMLLVFVEPLFCLTTRGPFDLEASSGAIWRRVEAEGARVLDATSALGAPETSLRPRDSHPSAAGHAAIALRVADQLSSSSWLADCGSLGGRSR